MDKKIVFEDTAKVKKLEEENTKLKEKLGKIGIQNIILTSKDLVKEIKQSRLQTKIELVSERLRRYL